MISSVIVGTLALRHHPCKALITFQCDKTPANNTPSLTDWPLHSTTEANFGPAPRAGPYQGSVVLALRAPASVGSVLVPDGAIQVLAMKPDRLMPDSKSEAVSDGNAPPAPAGDTLVESFKEDIGLSAAWVAVKSDAPRGRPALVAVPPGGIKTTALRFKTEQLDYALVMSHRLADVAPLAKCLFSEGAPTVAGGWRVDRGQTAITESRPGTVGLAWPAKQKLRGLTLVRPPAGQLKNQCRYTVAVWEGAQSLASAAALEDDSAWREVRNVTCDHTPMLQQVDFGGSIETCAVRIRFLNVVAKPSFQAGFDSIVAYQPLGDDAPDLPAELGQRVTVFKLPPPDDDQQQAKVERHIPVPEAGNLAFDGRGVLHCVAGKQVVTVPLAADEQSRVVVSADQLDAPLDLAFGPDGLLHVSDNGPKIVKVFKPDTGELVRTIGTKGGLVWGKWEPSRLQNPTGLAVDRLGRAWVADFCRAPKRVQRFSADGRPDREFLGPTQYGGGGTMDSKDRQFIYYNGMKFTINWEDRTWRLTSRLGPIGVDRTVYCHDRRYLVGPGPAGARLVSIAEERDDRAQLMAQAGILGEWAAVREAPEIRQQFGGLDLQRQFFIWSDRNGDRQPQANEVQICAVPDDNGWKVGEDLTILSSKHRLRPSSIRPDGVPVYEAKNMETYNAAIAPQHTDNPWGDDQGRIFTTGAKLIAADGQTILWQYYNEYNRHDGFYMTPFGRNRPPGVLNQEHWPIAHIKVPNAHGALEEYFITNSDPGDWFCYTADGLLVGCIVGGPAGYGRRGWPAEWNYGQTDLSDLRPGQEHYQGCVVRPDDGHVYAIVGHNHMSVVRVDGLEQLQRLQGTLTVSAGDIENTRLWQARQVTDKSTNQAPRVAKMLRTAKPPIVNGSIEDWPDELFVTISETIIRALHSKAEIAIDGIGALAYDKQALYVAMRVRDDSPLRNSAEDPLALFKNGDAAEVTLGLDPAAPAKRTDPGPDDVRLLFAVVKGAPLAVLYRPVDAKAPETVRREFSSPVGRVAFDRVEVLRSAKVAFQKKRFKDGMCWVMEAAVPWEALGLEPPAVGVALRGDLGYLESDQTGMQTVGRRYWSGKSQTIVSDLPSEARLNPAVWGTFQTVKSDAQLKMSVPSTETTLPGQHGLTDDIDTLLEK